jgi:hypothetical protein
MLSVGPTEVRNRANVNKIWDGVEFAEVEWRGVERSGEEWSGIL